MGQQPQESTVSPEGTLPSPAPPTLQHLLEAQPFIPGVPWTAARTRRSNQGTRTQQERAARDTSPPPTPPSSPQNTPTSARVSERQHRSPGLGVTSQPPPTTSPTAHLTPPSSPGPPPPPIRAPGELTRISIDPDRMDETLRHPFYQELTPFAGRHLGDFEWVAFEEALLRWSTAIKEVVTAQRGRPPTQHHSGHVAGGEENRRHGGHVPQPRQQNPTTTPPNHQRNRTRAQQTQ